MEFEKLYELAEKLPESVRDNAVELLTRMNTTIEGIGDTDVEWYPPLLKVVQGMSDRNKLPKGAMIGDVIIGERKVEAPLKFIPIRVYESRQYWSPDQNEARMLCSSPDAQVGYLGFNCKSCPHSKYDEEAKKSDCSKLEVVMAMSEDLSELFVINFAKTNYTEGRDFKSKLRKAMVPPYKRVYGLRSESSKQYKNVESIKIDVLEKDHQATKEAVLPFLVELFNQIGADRKKMLDEFHAMVKERQANGAGQLPAPVDSEIKQITLEAGAGESNVSELAGKYSI
jgi:hypothetical protein